MSRLICIKQHTERNTLRTLNFRGLLMENPSLMPAEEKTKPNSVRFGSSMERTIQELARKHSTNRSDYIRGLVYLDAHLAGYGTKSLNKPAWVSMDYEVLLSGPPLLGLGSKPDSPPDMPASKSKR
jgi:hypothetical protein